jgi:NADH:ubiquinone oxidoreductase subunit 3 (subunit A)
MPADHYPVLLALGFALALGGGIVAASSFIGSRTGGRVKLSTYESGEPLVDRSRKRISVLFFLVAIDFVIFDVEAAFLYPWVLVR